MSDDLIPKHLVPYLEQVDGLRRVGANFWERGWSRGTSSNYSTIVGRDQTQILITASGKDKGKLTRSDFVLVDREGQPIGEGQPKSSAETLLHCVAAEDPEVGAVLHTHSIWSTVLSDRFAPQGGILIEGYEMLKGLSGVTTHEHAEWIPIFDNTQDIPSLAQQVRETQQSDRPIAHCYIIRKHGIYTWGKDLDEAFRHIEVLEFLFECIGRTATMG
ncbi:MAG: methylthioribulose 1-phosphate dehydratase [Planctomycetota bacterium]